MIASAALIGINFQNGEVLKQIFSLSTGDENPIVSCEILKSRMESTFELFTFSIIANDEARNIYAQKIENHKT